MRKFGVFIVLFLVLLVSLSFTLAQTSNNSSNDDTFSTTDDTTASTVTTSSDSSSDSTGSLGDIDKGYQCLTEKAGTDCSKINDVVELSFIILATPDDIMDECVTRLKSKQKDNHYGTLKETAIATLALNHAGEDTELLEKWLLDRQMNPTDLTWYLQQDSDEPVKCNIEDDALRYEVEIDANKKIQSDAGKCLKRAQSNFWFQINPSCYATYFNISCDQDFITNLLYKNQKGSTIYVLEDTQVSPAFGTTVHAVNSKCLGTSGVCDYEATAWGALALQNTGNTIDQFIPYLIATANLKEQYLPNAFIYLITSYDDYGTRLIQDQRFGSYWQADQTAYNRYYDTSIALLALGLSLSQSSAAQDWLLFEQGVNGCWGNSVRETAFIVWALTQRDYVVVSSTVYCDEAGYYCVPDADCSVDNDVGENYYCSGLSNTCCKEKPPVEACNVMGGEVCGTGEICPGIPVTDLYGEACCLAGCQVDEEPLSECEEAGLNCYSECFEGLESASYSCSFGDVCCSPVPAPVDDGNGWPWWIWLLLLLIVIIIIAIIIVYRRKKQKEDEQKGETKSIPVGGMPPSRPGMQPTGPGMPPARRPGGPIRRVRRRRPGFPPKQQPQ